MSERVKKEAERLFAKKKKKRYLCNGEHKEERTDACGKVESPERTIP